MINVKLTQTESPLSFIDEEKEDVVEVTGFAVHEGTFNNITIRDEALNKSVQSLIGKPLLVNHSNNTTSVVGKVTNAWIGVDPSCNKRAVAYKADFDAEEVDILRKLKLGFLDSTSVGFSCDHICSICGSDIWKCAHWFEDEGFEVLAENIEFQELSIVAVPADKDASVKVNFSAEDTKRFEELKNQKEQLRRTNMSEFETKYNEVVEEFTQFKMEKGDEINDLKEEFKAEKEQLQADKAEKDTEIFSLKNEIEALKQDKENLSNKIEEYADAFDKLEDERLSGLRAKVAELSKEAKFGLTEEEINELGEPALNRYIEGFSAQLKHMVKIEDPAQSGGHEQYQSHEVDTDVSLADSLVGRLTHIRK